MTTQALAPGIHRLQALTGGRAYGGSVGASRIARRNGRQIFATGCKALVNAPDMSTEADGATQDLVGNLPGPGLAAAEPRRPVHHQLYLKILTCELSLTVPFVSGAVVHTYHLPLIFSYGSEFSGQGPLLWWWPGLSSGTLMSVQSSWVESTDFLPALSSDSLTHPFGGSSIVLIRFLMQLLADGTWHIPMFQISQRGGGADIAYISADLGAAVPVAADYRTFNAVWSGLLDATAFIAYMTQPFSTTQWPFRLEVYNGEGNGSLIAAGGASNDQDYAAWRVPGLTSPVLCTLLVTVTYGSIVRSWRITGTYTNGPFTWLGTSTFHEPAGGGSHTLRASMRWQESSWKLTLTVDAVTIYDLGAGSVSAATTSHFSASWAGSFVPPAGGGFVPVTVKVTS